MRSLPRMSSFSARSFTEMPSVTVMVRVMGGVPRGSARTPKSGWSGARSPSSGLLWSSRSAGCRGVGRDVPDAVRTVVLHLLRVRRRGRRDGPQSRGVQGIRDDRRERSRGVSRGPPGAPPGPSREGASGMHRAACAGCSGTACGRAAGESGATAAGAALARTWALKNRTAWRAAGRRRRRKIAGTRTGLGRWRRGERRRGGRAPADGARARAAARKVPGRGRMSCDGRGAGAGAARCGSVRRVTPQRVQWNVLGTAHDCDRSAVELAAGDGRRGRRRRTASQRRRAGARRLLRRVP